MKLVKVAEAMRDRAHEDWDAGKIGDKPEDRLAWRERLVTFGFVKLKEFGLVDAAAKAYLAQHARDITADLIKPTGLSPRVPAGQMKAWPNLAPAIGRSEMRRWARKYSGVNLSYQLVLRILGRLDAFFGDDEARFISFETLADACTAAGVDAKDIDALAA